MELLYSAAISWRDIAEGLGFVEDHIDEIYTNNETDVGCLRDVMEQWMRLGPTWEKLALLIASNFVKLFRLGLCLITQVF